MNGSGTFRLGVLAVLVLSGAFIVSCTSTSSSYGKDKETQNVGQYRPAPRGVEKPRIGVPDFDIQDKDLGKNASAVAADQLTTLLINSRRFRVIERAQLEQLVEEQGLEGVVRPDERAKRGKVRGIDYMMIGKITNFKLQKVEQGSNFGIGNVSIPGGGALGGLDIDKDETAVKANVGVDLRIVDPETGEAFVADSSDFTRVNKASAMGVRVLGTGTDANSDLEIQKDNQGKILRLALDDTLKQMIPRIDQMLKRRHKKKSGNSKGGSSN